MGEVRKCCLRGENGAFDSVLLRDRVGNADCSRSSVSLFHLYVDDSGSRYSDKPQAQRSDGMDHFALGGVLIDEKDIGAVQASHAAFMERWKLREPLHSTKISGSRGAFSWLSTDKARADEFHADLEAFILNAPILSISCVIDRPGYLARYTGKHPVPWLLCQTAFAILIERAAKYARERESRIAIYFEEAGKREDRGIMEYMKALKRVGMPFPGSTAAGYDSLTAQEFRALVRGEPNRVTKKVPMVQLADLVLYAMAKGGYDESYPPLLKLHQHGKIIDAVLAADDVPTRGVKYSCFDTKKARSDPSL